MCVELVGDRFLKRMVRVLVATAIRESHPEAPWFHPPETSGPRLRQQAGEAAGPDNAGNEVQQPSSQQQQQQVVQQQQQQHIAGPDHRHEPGDACRSASRQQEECGSGSSKLATEQCGGAPWHRALVELALLQERCCTAAPAPALGLCFLEAGFSAWPKSAWP